MSSVETKMPKLRSSTWILIAVWVSCLALYVVLPR